MLLQPGEPDYGVWQEEDDGSGPGADVDRTADHVDPTTADVGPMADDVGSTADDVGPTEDHVGPTAEHIDPVGDDPGDSGDDAGEMDHDSDEAGADDGSPGEDGNAVDQYFEDNLPVEVLALSKRPPTASEQEAALWALCFRALSDPTRIRIVALLCANRFSMTAGMVAYLLRIRPSALSYHLKVLREAGFVRTGRYRTSVNCRLLPDGLLTVLRAIGHLTPAYFEWSSSSNPRLQRKRMWFAEAWAHERAEAARRRGRRRKHLYEAT